MDELEVATLFAAANVGIDEGIDLPAFRLLTADRYLTRDGDTLEGVARLCGVPVAMLTRANLDYDAGLCKPDSALPMGVALRVLIPPVCEDLDNAATSLQGWWRGMRQGKFTGHDRRVLETAFAAVDRDASGTLDLGELVDSLCLLGEDPLDEDDAAALLKAGDTDNNGVLDLSEFLSLFGSRSFICLAADTLRGVASLCECDLESLARENGLDAATADDPLPSGLVLRITEE